ncbi:DUF3153 domain-containing protein [Synechococcus sp. CBW1107]|uniref:DUF3153 domain-containing protein n=1 Tax=Synechococcus sp. CBW1107 TaxID=2789857 RepID=UPI002AD2AE0F|nr:DUF3153 domain-containing protein [Synechococcus sp. CBW1107]CAK6688897.1 hypothetical protein ICNINCKA_00498 [Synechococcus sp. CBW1107]
MPPAGRVSRGVADDPLEPARAAIERGEYGRCLRLLEPIVAAHGVTVPLGGRALMLMATALIGQGESERAASCVRGLKACADPDLRRQARDLSLILEAPSLQRPENWSLTLPQIGAVESLQQRVVSLDQARPGRARPEAPPPPPVGPTRAPLGFAIVVAAVLLLLTGLLGGCLRVETDLSLPAPGRLELSQSLTSVSGSWMPWQRQFASTLADDADLSRFKLSLDPDQGRLSLSSGVVSPAEAAALLKRLALDAGELTGQALPAPQLSLQERNWLLGVRQQIGFELDLRQLQPLPGLSFKVRLSSMGVGAVRTAQPLAVEPRLKGLSWPLQLGAINRLELRSWRWSRLGLGSLLIVLLLVLSLLLQRLRRQAGFGWPELPSP